MEGLAFTSYDIRDGSPFNPTPDPTTGLCGIYVLEFTTGEQYVGQSLDVRQRVSEHRRRWDDIAVVRFAPCAPAELDSAEVDMIAHTGGRASLRNVLLTQRPGGLDDLVVETTEGRSVSLPWRRTDRLTVRHMPRSFTDSPVVSNSARDKADAFHAHDDAELTVRILGHYVHETIPAPIETAGDLWSITAMPTTGGATGKHHRAFTLNVGNVEAFWMIRDLREDFADLSWHLNIWNTELALIPEIQTLASSGWVSVEPDTGYADGAQIARVTALGEAAILAVLAIDAARDAAYRLNVHMMRKGGRANARFHNEALAHEVLASANDIAIAQRGLLPGA